MVLLVVLRTILLQDTKRVAETNRNSCKFHTNLSSFSDLQVVRPLEQNHHLYFVIVFKIFIALTSLVRCSFPLSRYLSSPSSSEKSGRLENSLKEEKFSHFNKSSMSSVFTPSEWTSSTHELIHFLSPCLTQLPTFLAYLIFIIYRRMRR